MRSTVVLLLVSLMSAAGISLPEAPVVAAAAQAPELEQPFTLKPGDAVLVGPERVEVGFKQVVSDSRCPRDVQCIQAGEAVVLAEVMRSGKARLLVHVKTTPNDASAAVGGFVLTLTNLLPIPLASRPPRPSEYRATFVLRRN